MTDLFAQKKTNKLKKDSYNSDDIIVLEGLEPVRKRPGMYIGGTDEKAYHHLIIEVLDNCIDEAIEGHANLIEIELLSLNTIKISDNGRGIPIDNHPKYPIFKYTLKYITFIIYLSCIDFIKYLHPYKYIKYNS